MAPDIYDALDYRSWLREALDDLKRRKPAASLRWCAGRIELDPGNLVRVLQGKLHLQERHLPAVAKLLDLDETEERCLDELLRLAKARSSRDTLASYERLQAIRGVPARVLEARQFEFFRHWRHAAIRGLLSLRPFDGDYRALGAALVPPATESDARESVELLLELGLVARRGESLEVTDKFVRPPRRTGLRTVRAFQAQTIQLAAESLDRVEPGLREISTATVTLPRADLDALRKRLVEFRDEIVSWAQGATDEDGVFQFTLALFPLALLDQARR